MAPKRTAPASKTSGPNDRRAAPKGALRVSEAPPAAHEEAPAPATTRERILATALDVFAEKGFEGTTTREICSRAGVNGAALNYHWRSKEQLWQAVGERCGAALMRVISSVDMSRPPADVITSFLTALFDDLARDPRPIRIVAWAAMQPETMDYEGTARVFRPLSDFAKGYVLQQQSLGRVPPDVDVEAIVPLVTGMFIYTLINRPGLKRYFGKDFTDPVHAARVRGVMVRSALGLLGLGAGAKPRRSKGG